MENMVDLRTFRDKKIFITGHTGFKGSWLSYILDKSGSKVKGFSLKPHTEPSLFSKLKYSNMFQTVIGDVRDYISRKRNKTFNQTLSFTLLLSQ